MLQSCYLLLYCVVKSGSPSVEPGGYMSGKPVELNKILESKDLENIIFN